MFLQFSRNLNKCFKVCLCVRFLVRKIKKVFERTTQKSIGKSGSHRNYREVLLASHDEKLRCHRLSFEHYLSKLSK